VSELARAGSRWYLISQTEAAFLRTLQYDLRTESSPRRAPQGARRHGTPPLRTGELWPARAQACARRDPHGETPAEDGDHADRCLPVGGRGAQHGQAEWRGGRGRRLQGGYGPA